MEGGRWRTDEIDHLLSRDEKSAIKSVAIPIRDLEDKRVWMHNKKGVYTVKSGYHLSRKLQGQDDDLMASSSFVVHEHLWEEVWKINAAEKIKHFVWRACNEALPTRVNLFKRKCVSNPLGPICNKEEESIEHLLLFCDWVKGVWFSSVLGLKWDRGRIRRIDEWWSEILCNREHMEKEQRDWFITQVAYICWGIWKGRCNYLFRNEEIDIQATGRSSYYAAVEFVNVNKPKCMMESGPGVSVVNGGWECPLAGRVKVNCDGAYGSKDKIGGLGVIVRNHHGEVINGRFRRFAASSALQAEAEALREAILMGIELNLDDLVFESDCLELVNAVEGKEEDWSWCCSAYLQDIWLLWDQLSRPALVHVSRRKNLAADWLDVPFGLGS